MTPDTNFWLQCADVYRHPTPPHPVMAILGHNGRSEWSTPKSTVLLSGFLGVPIILKVFEMVKGVESCQGQNVQKTGRENVSFSLERRPRD